MTKAIRVHQFGGPEVLTLDEVEVGQPGPGQVKLKQTALGLNFIDVYQRTGFYPQPLPFIPGSEGAGAVIAVGDGVEGLEVGDRVAYANAVGAYAEERLISADRVVRIPDGISNEVAASVMLKGLTAHYLLRRTYRVTSDTTLLFTPPRGVWD